MVTNYVHIFIDTPLRGAGDVSVRTNGVPQSIDRDRSRRGPIYFGDVSVARVIRLGMTLLLASALLADLTCIASGVAANAEVIDAVHIRTGGSAIACLAAPSERTARASRRISAHTRGGMG